MNFSDWNRFFLRVGRTQVLPLLLHLHNPENFNENLLQIVLQNLKTTLTRWLTYDPVQGSLKILNNDENVPTRSFPLRLVIPELTTFFHLLVYFVPRREQTTLLTSINTPSSTSSALSYVSFHLLDVTLILETLSPSTVISNSSELPPSAHTISHYFEPSSLSSSSSSSSSSLSNTSDNSVLSQLRSSQKKQETPSR